MIDQKSVIKDLRIFSDPATPFEHEVSGDKLRIKMVRDNDREYFFSFSDGTVLAVHDGRRRYASLASLLASPEFIDIRRIKSNQRRMLAQKYEENGSDVPFLEPEGVFILKNAQEHGFSSDELYAALTPDSSSNLKIILLDGPAGIGKTSLIERISYQRSAPDASLPPLLHVISGGGRLTDLPKALAFSSQLIRSAITFDQVPILARLGVIQVAIDGFDELVDPDGYKDAWSALREFLRDVGTGGPIILSGRDTFFDQQNFEKLLANRISSLLITQARLTTVTPDAARIFLGSSGWTPAALSAAQADGWFRRGSYQLRPFFLSQIAGENGWDDLNIAYGSPQSFLTNRMIRREAEILLRTVKVSIESAEAGLWDFFGIISEDMATQQAETVDEDFIAFACEIAFSSHVDSDDLQKLVHKASSFALLEAASGSGLRKLPHSEFQNQFLAHSIVGLALKSTTSSTFIRQAAISTGVGEAFSDFIVQLNKEDASIVHENLTAMMSQEKYSEKLSSNIASLLMASLRRADLNELNLNGLNVSEVRIIGVARKALLKNISFGHLDVSDADCSEIEFDSCSAHILSIDQASMLPLKMPSVLQLNINVDSSIDTYRVPIEILNQLKKVSVDKQKNHGSPFVDYFDRLCRAFIRQNQIRDHEEDASYNLVRDTRWPDVRQMVGSRIVEQSKTAGGPRSVFYRMIGAQGLLMPENDSDITIRQIIIEFGSNEKGNEKGSGKMGSG